MRIIQFNLLKDNTSPSQAAAWILAQRPDIVVLEEAARQGASIRDTVRTQLPYATDCLGRETRCSTVILSATRPTESGGLARGDPENRRALSAAWAKFETPAGPLIVVGVHYVRPWPFGDQTASRRLLADFIARQDTRDMIVAGDFNLAPWTFALRSQDEAWALRRVTRSLPTWSGEAPGGISPGSWLNPPLLPLDHIYVGSRWSPVSIRRGPFMGSDHRPVIADLKRTS